MVYWTVTIDEINEGYGLYKNLFWLYFKKNKIFIEE